jgi:hypothetical protein
MGYLEDVADISYAVRLIDSHTVSATSILDGFKEISSRSSISLQYLQSSVSIQRPAAKA